MNHDCCIDCDDCNRTGEEYRNTIYIEALEWLVNHAEGGGNWRRIAHQKIEDLKNSSKNQSHYQNDECGEPSQEAILIVHHKKNWNQEYKNHKRKEIRDEYTDTKK